MYISSPFHSVSQRDNLGLLIHILGQHLATDRLVRADFGKFDPLTASFAIGDQRYEALREHL